MELFETRQNNTFRWCPLYTVIDKNHHVLNSEVMFCFLWHHYCQFGRCGFLPSLIKEQPWDLNRIDSHLILLPSAEAPTQISPRPKPKLTAFLWPQGLVRAGRITAKLKTPPLDTNKGEQHEVGFHSTTEHSERIKLSHWAFGSNIPEIDILLRFPGI